jgi:hypothetical protein
MSARSLFLASAAVLALLPAVAGAKTDYEQVIKQTLLPNIQKIVADPAIVAAVKAQNEKHAALSEPQIVELDKQWRAETKAAAKPLIDGVLGNALSKHLKKVKDGGAGAYSEIFVMDNKGLNVGQSDITSDYWQGDEDKWQKTYRVGPQALVIDKVEFDESSQMFQSQVSVTVIDPATGQPIGAITIGVNVENLDK